MNTDNKEHDSETENDDREISHSFNKNKWKYL